MPIKVNILLAMVKSSAFGKHFMHLIQIFIDLKSKNAS